ncbi:hypothetical protein ERJ65_08160 [Lactobacillus helveticus]|uniref:hypothetical protein n=1 Tax=Lactobacillus helveticus TaxID=1587 RepID=UPI0011799142|nr:hypothetical protein [Lactobacillus helveticus]NHL91624.1 hypothetical protein [Lactobacillus helveticus]
MWIILVINLLVAMAIAYFGLKERQEGFNLFTAGAVFIVFGLILIRVPAKLDSQFLVDDPAD